MDRINATRTDLLVAWRLLNRSEELTERAKNKKTKTKSFKETLEEEKELFGLNSNTAEKQSASNKKVENVNVKLSDLIGKLQSLNGNGGCHKTSSSEQVSISYERRETEVTVNYRILPKVEGLVVRNKHLAETDRYSFEFLDGATFKILDKWSGKSTTIWGDPHVDTSDEEGNCNGEFSDLKSSDSFTTLKLEDGTQVTFTAKDNGVIEAVDIYKGIQHLSGIGAAYSDSTLANSLFADTVDVSGESGRAPLGDVVIAGGDGNDWFNTSGQMVWGKTTGPRVTSRPYSVMEVNIRESVDSAFFSNTIDQEA